MLNKFPTWREANKSLRAYTKAVESVAASATKCGFTTLERFHIMARSYYTHPKRIQQWNAWPVQEQDWQAGHLAMAALALVKSWEGTERHVPLPGPDGILERKGTPAP